VLETKLAVYALSAGIAGFAGAFFAMNAGTLNGPTGFEMIAGLPIVLALVIGGVGRRGRVVRRSLRSFLIIIQSDWHISLGSESPTWPPLAVLASSRTRPGRRADREALPGCFRAARRAAPHDYER